MPEQRLIFVYGTLRRGGVRGIPSLFPDAELIGAGAVKGRLYDFGAYPGLLCDPAGGDVQGEVYRVDDAALRAMDEIERFVEGDDEACYYFRREHLVALRDGRSVTAWLYECNPRYYACSAPIAGGDWIAHAASKGDLPPEAWPDGANIAGRTPS